MMRLYANHWNDSFVDQLEAQCDEEWVTRRTAFHPVREEHTTTVNDRSDTVCETGDDQRHNNF